MQVETKYDLGDKTWILVETAKQIVKQCSECGRILVNKFEYGVQQVTVETISYMKLARCKEEDSDRISYHFKEEESGIYGDMESYIRDETNTFPTKKEALIAAGLRNNADSNKTINN